MELARQKGIAVIEDAAHGFGGTYHGAIRVQSNDPDEAVVTVPTTLVAVGTPEEVGNMVAFLASSRASWVSGASVVVDGCQSRSLI